MLRLSWVRLRDPQGLRSLPRMPAVSVFFGIARFQAYLPLPVGFGTSAPFSVSPHLHVWFSVQMCSIPWFIQFKLSFLVIRMSCDHISAGAYPS